MLARRRAVVIRELQRPRGVSLSNDSLHRQVRTSCLDERAVALSRRLMDLRAHIVHERCPIAKSSMECFLG
jgi:hypothetical protein